MGVANFVASVAPNQINKNDDLDFLKNPNNLEPIYLKNLEIENRKNQFLFVNCVRHIMS